MSSPPLPRVRRALASAAPFALVGLLGILVAACDAPPPASSLREWTPEDHDRTEETARGAQPKPAAKGAAATGGARPGPDAVLEASWTQQCAACHGRIGHGDGPTGPMVHAADLTREEWQSSVTDEQISAVIVSGKGKMPAFANLPARIVTGLVARIRATRGR